MKTLKIKHQTGYVELKVPGYFKAIDIPTIKKALKLARVYCTHNEQRELILNLKAETAISTGLQRKKLERVVQIIQEQEWW